MIKQPTLLVSGFAQTIGAVAQAPAQPLLATVKPVSIPRDCTNLGAKRDPADPNVMVLPVEIEVFGKGPAPVVRRKVPLTMGAWEISYCDKVEVLVIAYGSSPAAPPAYRTCLANMNLYPRGVAMTTTIRTGEAIIGKLGLSGQVRSRTGGGMIGANRATFYRVSGTRISPLGTKMDTSITFGTAKAPPVGAPADWVMHDAVSWTFWASTDISKGPSCIFVHGGLTNDVKAFPVGAAETVWLDS